ncbi:hypothetical protein [Synechococcus sp. CC9616]|uniref:hypothetical protein n=1 Tax=Synechococcus sp. CC9616 TaxID=110663 RepID=UPI00048AEE51
MFQPVWHTGIRCEAEFSLALVAFVLLVGWRQPAWRVVLFCSGVDVCPWPDRFLCRITSLMGSVVAGAGVNPADQRWGW